MPRTYDWDEEGLVVEGENCPSCNSSSTRYDNAFGYWKCEDCSTVWGHDKNDPDYDDLDFCPTCLGAKPADPEEEFTDCPTCGGTGYV